MEMCGDDKYCLVAAGKYLQMVQNNDNILFECTQEEYDTIWRNYFDMETDYAEIIDGIDVNDIYLTSAAEYGKGIRILNQDLWEMIISFIISQQNNIKRIRKCIKLLCERFGEKKFLQAESHTTTFRHRSHLLTQKWKICTHAI